MSQELKPCPFCGAEPWLDTFKNKIYCTNQNCLMRPKTPLLATQEQSIAAWNTRSDAHLQRSGSCGHSVFDCKSDCVSCLQFALAELNKRVSESQAQSLESLPKQACGHSVAWEIYSAETGKVLYCDICNTRSELRDALQMEAEYKDKLAHLLRSHEALREALEAWMDWNEQTSWCSADETEQDRRELMFNSRAALTEAAAQKENGNG